MFFAFLIAAYIYFYRRDRARAECRQQPGPAAHADFYDLPACEQRHAVAGRAASGGGASGAVSERGWARPLCSGGVSLPARRWSTAGCCRKNVTPERNLFGATFFTLTGFHGFHVLCGLIALMRAPDAHVHAAISERKRRSGVGAISMYWHFVDAVWIVIFSLVYLTVWL